MGIRVPFGRIILTKKFKLVDNRTAARGYHYAFTTKIKQNNQRDKANFAVAKVYRLCLPIGVGNLFKNS